MAKQKIYDPPSLEDFFHGFLSPILLWSPNELALLLLWTNLQEKQIYNDLHWWCFFSCCRTLNMYIYNISICTHIYLRWSKLCIYIQINEQIYVHLSYVVTHPISFTIELTPHFPSGHQHHDTVCIHIYIWNPSRNGRFSMSTGVACLLQTWPGHAESPAGQDEKIPTRTSTSENLNGEVCFPK